MMTHAVKQNENVNILAVNFSSLWSKRIARITKFWKETCRISFVFVIAVKLNTICGILSLYLAWDLFSLSIAIIQNQSNEYAVELVFALLRVLIIYTVVPKGCMWISLASVTNNARIQHIPLRGQLYLCFIIFGYLKPISSEGTRLVFLGFVEDLLKGSNWNQCSHQIISQTVTSYPLRRMPVSCSTSLAA